MFKPDSPLEIILAGAPSFSLKNNRVIVKKRNGGFALVPNSAVTKYMNGLRATMQRQLPNPWTMIEGGIGVVLEMYLYYKSIFPRSDVDNFYTTVQECLQEVIVPDDKQVEYFLALRHRTQSKEGQYSKLWLWETQGDVFTELQTFIQYHKELTKNGFGNSTNSVGIERRTNSIATEIAAIDTF